VGLASGNAMAAGCGCRIQPCGCTPPVVLVSCAGPDDRNDPLEIVALGRGRPSLEIGVQVSATRAGTPEYPTHSWIAAYAAGRLGQCGPCGGAALHLNGRWCRAACAGTLPAEAGALWGISAGGVHAFDRLQLNFDAAADGISAGPLAAFIGSQARRVVLQAKPANMALLAGLDRLGAAFDVLFDASGGAGQRPDAWPEALPGRFNAWAGGLGPDTAPDDIPRIAGMAAAGGLRHFGLDAQRRLRTADGSRFDPGRAAAFHQAAEAWNVQRHPRTRQG